MTLSLRNYAKYFVLFSVLLIAASIGLSYVNLSLPTGLGTILPPMFAAQMLGLRYGQSTGAPLAKGEAWRFAVPMTVCAVVIQLGMMTMWVLIMTDGSVDLMASFAYIGVTVLAGIFLLMVGMIYLVNRIFLGLGVRNGVKVAERKSTGS